MRHAPALCVAALLSIWAIVPQVWHRVARGHFSPIGLHVDALSWKASIGIPGQTMLYRPELSNFGFWPVAFSACDFVSDTLTPGTEYAYGIQRWNPSAKTWDTVSLPDPESFCAPEPLSKGDVSERIRYVWPGQTVKVMEFEAVGVRPEFRKGDLARFVVFRSPSLSVDWSASVASNGVRIEDDFDHSHDGLYRIRH